MVWYSHLLKNFSEFVVTHTVKKNCLPLLKNHSLSLFLRTDTLNPKTKDKDSGSLPPSSAEFLERKRVSFYPILHLAPALHRR